MKKKGLAFIACLLVTGFNFCLAQKVSLEIIDTDLTTKTYTINWPFQNGIPPAGAERSLIKVVDGILSDNKIDCPPKRQKVSDNIWLCGNGKKIRAKDNELANLLSKAWDQ